MKQYEITLNSDSGIINIRTRARNIQSAIDIICKAENAPKSAVISWRIIPTKKQIQKTQRLLIGI